MPTDFLYGTILKSSAPEIKLIFRSSRLRNNRATKAISCTRMTKNSLLAAPTMKLYIWRGVSGKSGWRGSPNGDMIPFINHRIVNGATRHLEYSSSQPAPVRRDPLSFITANILETIVYGVHITLNRTLVRAFMNCKYIASTQDRVRAKVAAMRRRRRSLLST